MNQGYLEIQGFGLRQKINQIEWPFNENLISVSMQTGFSFSVVTPFADSVKFYARLSRRQRFKQNLLAITRMPELIFSRKWAKFTLRYMLPLSLRDQELSRCDKIDFKGFYVSREVARFGFPTNEIGNTLEYELIRNWKNYQVLFTRGRIKIHSMKIPSLESKSLFQVKEFRDLIDKYLPGNYLSGYFENPNKITDTRFDRIRFSGSVHLLSGKPLSDRYYENWNSVKLQKATVIHGKVAFADGKFYTGDNTKVPSYGSSFNSWPGFVYQRIDEGYMTEAKNLVQPDLEEAFLLGGTKNWMHFLIEDIPRLFIFDTLDINNEIPLLVSSELGLQILESIRGLCSRPIVLLEPNSYLRVKCLHILQFNNPLVSTMAGDERASSVLFHPELLQQARRVLSTQIENVGQSPSKVLIRREAGLFRPLINASRLQNVLESRFGFKTFYLSDLSLQQISSIFSEAKIVVGEYGAGLANIIFCKPDCKILELRGGLESGAREYQALAEALGLEHSFINGKNRLVSRFGVSRGPYKIKVGSVARLMDSLCEEI